MSNSASGPARSSVDDESRLTQRGTSTIYKQTPRAPHRVRIPTTGNRGIMTHNWSTAASVCRLHYRPRPHCSSATLLRFALQLGTPVVMLRNVPTVPSCQLQLSTQANVSIVLYGCGLNVAVHRVASPPGTSVHHSQSHIIAHCKSSHSQVGRTIHQMGTSKIVKSDNDAPFQSAEFGNYALLSGFKHRRVTPLWPEVNGKAERFVKTIKAIRVAKVEGWHLEMYTFLQN